MLPNETLALLIPILALMIPIVAIVTDHQRKLAEIKMRTGTKVTPQVEAELSALRREVAELRDTATNYDMSFDAALTRLEQRVDRVEQRPVPSAYSSRDYTQADGATATQTVGR